jgi:hypothetical protein
MIHDTYDDDDDMMRMIMMKTWMGMMIINDHDYNSIFNKNLIIRGVEFLHQRRLIIDNSRLVIVVVYSTS